MPGSDIPQGVIPEILVEFRRIGDTLTTLAERMGRIDERVEVLENNSILMADQQVRINTLENKLLNMDERDLKRANKEKYFWGVIWGLLGTIGGSILTSVLKVKFHLP